MKKVERVSDPIHSTKILQKERAKSAPPIDSRHEKFQLGTNPMAMTDFEHSLVRKEAQERKDHRHDYIKGIQGRDGGCYSQKYEREYEDGPDVN